MVNKVILITLIISSLILIAAKDRLPTIGQLMYLSKAEYAAITTGCPLTYHKKKKMFQCIADVAGSGFLLIHDFPADAIGTYMNVFQTWKGPVLRCFVDGYPCVLVFQPDALTKEAIPLISNIPPINVTPDRLIVSFHGTIGHVGNVIIGYDWCVSDIGDPPCRPDWSGMVTEPVLVSHNYRQTHEFDISTIPVGINDQLVIHFARISQAALDTYESNLELENAKIIWSVD